MGRSAAAGSSEDGSAAPSSAAVADVCDSALTGTDEDDTATAARFSNHSGTRNKRGPCRPAARGVTRRRKLRAQVDGCGDQHPRPERPGQPRCNSSSGDAQGSPRSWHHFGQVGPDGCPGFKGPFPQPVSMSGGKFRCHSTLAQGTAGATRGLARRQATRSFRRQRRLRSGRVPKTVRAMDGAAGAPRDGFTAFFGTRPDRGRLMALAAARLTPANPSPSCANRSNVLTCYHINTRPPLETP